MHIRYRDQLREGKSGIVSTSGASTLRDRNKELPTRTILCGRIAIYRQVNPMMVFYPGLDESGSGVHNLRQREI
jgi:hypothetical protein